LWLMPLILSLVLVWTDAGTEIQQKEPYS
jgi:hypothetical protein